MGLFAGHQGFFTGALKRVVSILHKIYDADVDVKTAQKLLGHKDLSVTMKIYTHLSEKKEAIGIERLNNHLNGTPDQRALMNA